MKTQSNKPGIAAIILLLLAMAGMGALIAGSIINHPPGPTPRPTVNLTVCPAATCATSTPTSTPTPTFVPPVPTIPPVVTTQPTVKPPTAQPTIPPIVTEVPTVPGPVGTQGTRP